MTKSIGVIAKSWTCNAPPNMNKNEPHLSQHVNTKWVTRMDLLAFAGWIGKPWTEAWPVWPGKSDGQEWSWQLWRTSRIHSICPSSGWCWLIFPLDSMSGIRPGTVCPRQPKFVASLRIRSSHLLRNPPYEMLKTTAPLIRKWMQGTWAPFRNKFCLCPSFYVLIRTDTEEFNVLYRLLFRDRSPRSLRAPTSGNFMCPRLKEMKVPLVAIRTQGNPGSAIKINIKFMSPFE